LKQRRQTGVGRTGLSFQPAKTAQRESPRSAAGIGIEFKYGRPWIAPGARYTKLDRPNANEVTSETAKETGWPKRNLPPPKH
jgi:hypothetical protein